LSADDWDNQMLFFLAEGYRVIAIDRRGHGRSDQVSEGHDMDHYAADASAVVEPGSAQCRARRSLYRRRPGRPLCSENTASRRARRQSGARQRRSPLMVKTENNPGGTPIEVFDGFRSALAANRAQFYLDVASGPFTVLWDGAEVSQGTFRTGGVRE
jgi:hypothetical protein